MKVKIKDLARQAGLIAPYGTEREGLANFDYRQFAKLIIEECEKVVFENYDGFSSLIQPEDLTNHFEE